MECRDRRRDHFLWHEHGMRLTVLLNSCLSFWLYLNVCIQAWVDSLLRTQSFFRKQPNKKVDIEVAYYYRSAFSNCPYGKGIYTLNYPASSWLKHPTCALMVLRIQGLVRTFVQGGETKTQVDTYVNDAEPNATIYVHKNDSLVVPLLTFDNTMLNPRNWACPPSLVLMDLHNPIAGLVERTLNGKGRADGPPVVAVPSGPVASFDKNADNSLQVSVAERSPSTTVVYKMPTVHTPLSLSADSCYTTDLHEVGPKRRCCVCKEPASASDKGIAIRLSQCGHEMHWSCLQSSVSSPPACPVCSKRLQNGVLSGTMPSGKMTVAAISQNWIECKEEKILEIAYEFPEGFQRGYHPQPGVKYEKARFTSYIPNSPQGNRLLHRLQLAFERGLVFTFLNGAIVWGTIPHFSSLEDCA